jgi:hypothetical protein
MQIRRTFPRAIQDEQLMFEQNGFCDYRADAARSPEPANGNEEMDQKDNGIAHISILSATAKT